MTATDLLPNGTRVTLTTTLDIHTAGAHGTVHGSWASHTGVIFDTNPGYIRYVPTTYLTAHQDVADVTRAAEEAVLHIIEAAHDMDTPCNAQPDCPNTAVWWWECACGTPRYACEPHRNRYDLWHETRERACSRCLHTIPNPIPWRAL